MDVGGRVLAVLHKLQEKLGQILPDQIVHQIQWFPDRILKGYLGIREKHKRGAPFVLIKRDRGEFEE